MNLYHDSRSPECRAPVGAAPCGYPTRLRLFGTENIGRAQLIWMVNGKREYMDMSPAGDDCFEARLHAPDAPAICQYFFYVENRSGAGEYYGNAWDGLGGVGTASGPEPVPYQVTVYDPAYRTPEYLRNGVMYQIFPDRFYRSRMPRSERKDLLLHERWEDTPLRRVESVPDKDNYALDFFGGDLKGIEEKLDTLRELGVTVLYLNPIFRARSNHRYDTGDYEQIDPLLGDEEAFSSLCRAAQQRGMRVMLDGVFSHTGADSRYFNWYGHYGETGACQSKESRYYPWYTFRQWPDDYACWWGITTVPELNKRNEDVREYFLGEDGIVRRWIRQGAAGWRLDVADELPMDYLRRLRKSAKAEREDAVVLGEVWEDASHKVAYGKMRSYCLGDTLDSVMNYPLRSAIIDFIMGRSDAEALCRLIRSQQENYPVPFYYSLMNLLGSHDRPRILSLFCGAVSGDDDHGNGEAIQVSAEALALGRRRLLAAMEIVTALPGIPCVYYGDECGAQGAADPYCRGTYPLGREDKSLREAYRDLLELRRQPVVRTGRLTVRSEGPDVIVIRREISGGHDVFGDPAENATFEARITRP